MLENLTPPEVVRSCAVRTIAGSLSDSDREVFMAAVNDEVKWQAFTLSKVLAGRGVTISDRSIRHHRIKACSCSKI